MKITAYPLLFITCFFFINSLFAQGDEFDFWVGKWDLTWKDSDGTIAKGSNNIIKILDGKVIQENFEAFTGQLAGFKGTSISVYNPNNKSWHQAWADNQGSYYNFIGEIDGDRKIFKTLSRKEGEKEIILRMVFHHISNDSLTWDWERTEDGGKSWTLNWSIDYVKVSQ